MRRSIEFPADDWNEVLHYGRVLTREEQAWLRNLLVDLMAGRVTFEEAEQRRRARGLLTRSEQCEQEEGTTDGELDTTSCATSSFDPPV